MTKFLLIVLLMSPIGIAWEYIPPNYYFNHELIVLCLNGGRASLWGIHGKFLGYIECKQINPPKRFPR